MLGQYSRMYSKSPVWPGRAWQGAKGGAKKYGGGNILSPDKASPPYATRASATPATAALGGGGDLSFPPMHISHACPAWTALPTYTPTL